MKRPNGLTLYTGPSAILGRVIAAHGATRRRFAQRMEG